MRMRLPRLPAVIKTCYTFRMVATERMIRILRPAASCILAVDQDAMAGISRRRSLFAAADQQPAAVAIAAERRMFVATAMRAEIAPALGWELIEEHLDSGAYEWLVEASVTVRLSKTTPESRREVAKQLLGVQPELEHFLMPPPPRPTSIEETILVRLNGDRFGRPVVDVIAAGPKGPVGTAVSLRAIAEMEAEEIRPAVEALPSKPKVSLPGAPPAREQG